MSAIFAFPVLYVLGMVVIWVPFRVGDFRADSRKTMWTAIILWPIFSIVMAAAMCRRATLEKDNG